MLEAMTEDRRLEDGRAATVPRQPIDQERSAPQANWRAARVSIPCLEGVVWREATGTEDGELRGYGDPSSNAEAMALKRAASKFGLGLYLYQN